MFYAAFTIRGRIVEWRCLSLCLSIYLSVLFGFVSPEIFPVRRVKCRSHFKGRKVEGQACTVFQMHLYSKTHAWGFKVHRGAWLLLKIGIDTLAVRWEDHTLWQPFHHTDLIS